MAIETTAPEELAVAAADREAQEHAHQAAELERRVAEGHDDVTADDIDRQHGLARFAKFRAAGARRKAELAEQARIKQARKDLRAEIEGASLHSGDKLADLLRAANTSVRAFMTATDERDYQIGGWVKRAKELGVPNTGVASADHEGLGLGGPGDVLAGDLVITRVNGYAALGVLFGAGEYGAILPHPEIDPNDPIPGRTRLDRICADIIRQSGKAG